MDRQNDPVRLDLRVRRTYKLLKDAFTALLMEKSFDRITVQEICERAMVRRTTFYQHFDDKQDFLIWFIREMQRDFISRSGLGIGGHDDLADCLSDLGIRILRFLRENRRIIDALTCSATEDVSPLKEFSSACVTELTECLENWNARSGGILPVTPGLAAEYYVGGVAAIARWWYVGGCSADENEIASAIRILARGLFASVIRTGKAETV